MMKHLIKKTDKPIAQRLNPAVALLPPVIAIGASAGGLEAFEAFFHACPVDTGMAFVLVQHLDPNHPSLLTEILKRSTGMPVAEAIDQVAIVPNHIYIIPPNCEMAISNGRLQLFVPTQARGHRLPIDRFMRSLAEDQTDCAVGIILSGTASDGTLGLRAIFGAGGICMVQEPSTAKYDGMPQSAIDAGYVTHILPVEQMPAMLIELIQQPAFRQRIPRIIPPQILSSLNEILQQICRVTGHDFSSYLKSNVGRRIERRMALNKIDEMAIYVRFLKTDPGEAQILFKDFLNNFTSFFRDPEVFIVLKHEILPQLLINKPDGYVLRVWVAACATGEEAYSIAIVLCELMEEMGHQFKVLIYATDLDGEAIIAARSGCYLPHIVRDVSPERLSRFFTRMDGGPDINAGYKINQTIREMVVFAEQSVIKDPPFTKLDLLSCRNLMIYLEPEQQDRLIEIFHTSLKAGGVLLLSTSESVRHHPDWFLELNRQSKFYQAMKNQDSPEICAPSSVPIHITSPMDNRLPEAERFEYLERELAYAKKNLEATIKVLSSTNEELKSSNEELQATNEELQSTNEALENSRTELQSHSQQALGVNAELNATNDRLNGIREDLNNLLNNVASGTLFLDQNLMIQRYTREVLAIYPLIASDIGRVLSDIQPMTDSNELLADLRTVLATQNPTEREVRGLDGNCYLACIKPYRTLENNIAGVVLSFINITSMKLVRAA